MLHHKHSSQIYLKCLKYTKKNCTYNVKHGCYCYCKCNIPGLCGQLVDWNVTQNSPWFVFLSTVVAAWQMKKLTDDDQRPLKHNKPLERVAFGLNINTSLLLYLSFALIRQKMSEQVSCNPCTLKTEPHYILLVTTLEFLLLIHCCK